MKADKACCLNVQLTSATSLTAQRCSQVVLSNALEPDPSSLFGLLQGGEQNAGQNAFDRLVQQGQPKELYIKSAGGLSEAGRNSSGPRDWGVKTHFDPRVLPGHGWAPLQASALDIWGRTLLIPAHSMRGKPGSRDASGRFKLFGPPRRPLSGSVECRC